MRQKFVPNDQDIDILRRLSHQYKGMWNSITQLLEITPEELGARIQDSPIYRMAWEEGRACKTMPPKWKPSEVAIKRIEELSYLGWSELKAISEALGWTQTPVDFRYILIDFPEMHEAHEAGVERRKAVLADHQANQYDPTPEDIEFVRKGASEFKRLRNLAARLNTTEAKLKEAMKRVPELQKAYDLGIAENEDWILEQLKLGIENGADKGAVQGILWILKKNGYGDNEKAEEPTKTNNQGVLKLTPKTSRSDFEEKARLAREQRKRNLENAGNS